MVVWAKNSTPIDELLGLANLLRLATTTSTLYSKCMAQAISLNMQRQTLPPLISGFKSSLNPTFPDIAAATATDSFQTEHRLEDCFPGLAGDNRGPVYARLGAAGFESCSHAQILTLCLRR